MHDKEHREGGFVHIHTTDFSRQMACNTYCKKEVGRTEQGNRNIFLTLHYMDVVTLRCRAFRECVGEIDNRFNRECVTLCKRVLHKF